MNTADAEFLHELRNLARTLTLIHKDLQKLNTRIFVTMPIETDKSDQTDEQLPTT